MGKTVLCLRAALAPVVTPFSADFEPLPALWIEHCQWLLDNAAGLALFGTNSEANSLSTGEKAQLLERIVAAGLPPAQMMVGNGCCALTDTVELSRRALALGINKVLMLPPFYYKNVCDDGLYRYFSEVIQRLGEARLRIYLYHIPQIAQVGIGMSLIERLLRRYPQVIAGIKDSSGDWRNTEALLKQFQSPGFDVFAGSDNALLATLRAGGAGCISATVNINPAAIALLARSFRAEDADQQQQQLDRVRRIIQQYPLAAALKTVLAHYRECADWRHLRPPLMALPQAAAKALISQLDEIGFTL